MAKLHTDRECEALLVRLREEVSDSLSGLITTEKPDVLYDSARYVLAGEGKHVRPVLVLVSSAIYGEPSARAMPAALAVELVHDFALVHDDIMDHAESRRARPAVHVAWNEDTAILCGDLLLSMSFDQVARTPSGRVPELVQAFAAMVAALCEGQALDKDFERRPLVYTAQYLDMIDRKTGALLSVALEMGGIIGDAPEDMLAALRSIGRQMGRAFQIQDDLLDLVAGDPGWGKPVGGDLMEGKKTFLLLEALERAEGEDRAYFSRIRKDSGLVESEIPEARQRMQALGVLDAARERVQQHSAAALARVQALPQGLATSALVRLIEQMALRRR